MKLLPVAVCASVLCVSTASAASLPMKHLSTGASINCSTVTRDYVQKTLSGALAKMEFNAATSEAQAAAVIAKLDTVVSRATQLAGATKNANKANTQCVLSFVVQSCNETKDRIVGWDALNDALADFSSQPEIVAALGVTNAMTASIPSASEPSLSTILGSSLGQANSAGSSASSSPIPSPAPSPAPIMVADVVPSSTASGDSATSTSRADAAPVSATPSATTANAVVSPAPAAVAASASASPSAPPVAATSASATIPDGYTDFRFSLPSSVYEWGAYFYPTDVEARSCKNNVCAWSPVPRSSVVWDLRGMNGNETLASTESSSVTLSNGKVAYTRIIGPKVQTTPVFGASIYGWHPDYSGLMGIGSPSDFFADGSRKVTVSGKFIPPTGGAPLTYEREMSVLNEFDAKLVATNSFLADAPVNAAGGPSSLRHVLEIRLLRSGAMFGANPVFTPATSAELAGFAGECTVTSADGRHRGTVQYLDSANQVVVPSKAGIIPSARFVVSSFPSVPAGTVVWARCRMTETKSGHVKSVSTYEQKK